MKIDKNIVTIGGGTGTSVVLSALQKIQSLNLNAIISVCDNGGSTGRLRDEFGFLPVGDLRQAIAAMTSNSHNDWLRKLLLYRFEKGTGLKGHNLGNLILTALQDMSGSTENALDIASKIFRLHGEVIPVTTQDTHIVTSYEDGTVEFGEKVLDEKNGGIKIIGIRTEPKAKIYEKAAIAIENAEYIIIGPGDLYASIMANLIVEGVSEAIIKSKAKIILVMNLMTKFTQTHGMSANDHLSLIEKTLNKKVDYILMNSEKIPKDIENMYLADREYLVVDDMDGDNRVIRADFVKPVVIVKSENDSVHRSFLRHDPKSLENVFRQIIV
ncbi:MAG: uridine diphosphate-N-acetylglucosamine-binding protein YvcK [bacterium]|nr:uridine diphosphate-N-acetylglucosamine-binding protein YvcK [bacterium]